MVVKKIRAKRFVVSLENMGNTKSLRSVRSAFAAFTVALIFSVLPGIPQAVADADPGGKRYAHVSWGDMVWLYGPGTDAAMENPESLEKMIKYWKARGFAGVYMRTDLREIEPFVHRHPRSALTPGAAVLLKSVDDVMDHFDIQGTGQQISEKNGFEFWAYHPHLYSDGAPVDAGAPGVGRNWPWPYEVKYLKDHPEAITVDRKGNKYWMVREYAYPEARSSKVDEFVYMAKTFGLKYFLADLRSEASQMQDPPDKADRFGFNKPVVEDMKRLYGVDILTDPRFDVDSSSFDLRDPMVENWRTLRGSYLTQFFRELRKALRDENPNIRLAVSLSGDHIGPPLGNWRLEWRKWVDEGLVDEMVGPLSFEATLDNESATKGYLTNINANEGVLSFSTLKDYIRGSKHPEIKLISPGAPSYFYPPPPPGTDGWRCNMFYDLYHVAWFQRWKQWMTDLKDLGSINFLKQDFDTFPLNNNGYGGGWGDSRYFPALRACPGVWQTLGDGKDGKPVAQEVVRLGDKGRAIKLTSGFPLEGRHYSAPDRSTSTACLGTAITNGVSELEFWLFRQSEDSAVTAYLRGDSDETDIGLKIAAETGMVAYSNQGKWVGTPYSVPVGEWQKFTIKVDLDQRTYSAFLGQEKVPVLCEAVPLVIPKARIIEEIGIHLPIEVPVFKYLNRVYFSPEGPAEGVTYLDDVTVKWRPTLYYAEPGSSIRFADDFESQSPANPFSGTQPSKGARWEIPKKAGTGFSIENHTSYGEGVHCLRSHGGSDIMAVPDKPIVLNESKIVTADLDLFIRSDSSFAHIIPSPLTKSKHQVTIGFKGSSAESQVASVRAGDGTWQYWDGAKFVDSKVRIAYDVWNHLQLALDRATNSYQAVVQPVGEVPILIGKGKLGLDGGANSEVVFSLSPSASQDHLSCYDNLVIATTPKNLP